MAGSRAVVFGGSGNVGKQLIATLFANAPETYAKITLISRRPLPEYDVEKYKGVVDVRVVRSIDEVGSEDLCGHDVAFMVLGAGKPSQLSRDELMRVECTLPVSFAAACKRSGVAHFSAMSAYGADSSQTYNPITKTTAGGGWNSHTKGVMEEEVEKQGFSSLALFRPAAIYPGNTNTPEFFGWLNSKLNWILPGAFNTVSTTEIALGMHLTMLKQLRGPTPSKIIVDGGSAISRCAAGAE